MELAGLGEVQGDKQVYITAGEMISQVGLYTQDNADKLKAKSGGNLYRFFSTPEEEAQLINASEQYVAYLQKLRKTIDELTSDPMYQVAVGDAGGRVRDRGIGQTIEKAYNRANNIK